MTPGRGAATRLGFVALFIGGYTALAGMLSVAVTDTVNATRPRASPCCC